MSLIISEHTRLFIQFILNSGGTINL